MGHDVAREQLMHECEFRVRALEPGYEVRVDIDAGTILYDPILGWVDGDGSLVFSDHGPQRDPLHWNPDEGHGAIYRYHRSGALDQLIGPNSLPGMPYMIRKAPEWFGPWGGHLFFPSQLGGGRAGALKGHGIFRLDPATRTPVLVAEIPKAGTIGGGEPGAAMIGGFSPPGSGLEDVYLCQTMMNCVIYKVGIDGSIEPYIILDEPNVPYPIMPYYIFWATGPIWGEHEGKLLLCGVADKSFEAEAPSDHKVDYFVIANDKVDPEPILHADIGVSMAEVAPPEFGPFAGHTFLADFGSINLMHVSKPPDGPLPYDVRILRIDPEGNTHVFADGFQGGWVELRFSGDRMYVSTLRRSYSTGEYHEPDGSLYEINYTGARG